jgi:hypothetical protein
VSLSVYRSSHILQNILYFSEVAHDKRGLVTYMIWFGHNPSPCKYRTSKAGSARLYYKRRQSDTLTTRISPSTQLSLSLSLSLSSLSLSLQMSVDKIDFVALLLPLVIFLHLFRERELSPIQVFLSLSLSHTSFSRQLLATACLCCCGGRSIIIFQNFSFFSFMSDFLRESTRAARLRRERLPCSQGATKRRRRSSQKPRRRKGRQDRVRMS